MCIEILAMVTLYGDSWEEAFRHKEEEKWKKWAMARYRREKYDTHAMDALRYGISQVKIESQKT